MELSHSSQVIAAYIGDEFVGVLLADMKGESKAYKSFWKSIYIKFVDWIQNTFVKDGVGPYDIANEEMLKNYKEKDKTIFYIQMINVHISFMNIEALNELAKRILNLKLKIEKIH